MDVHSGRGFREIRVSPCGVQCGRSLDPDADPPPSTAMFRNNLTALSQVWNLYFIAHQASIYVYQPQYHTQSVPTRPAVVIPLPVSQPGLQGYIDNQHFPHAVNNILVADLGEQEVLACACDDGDLVVYYTRDIIETISRGQRGNKSQPVENTDILIRPMLCINVGKSAWGLAVHTNSRMIAVSSNTGRISIFAFGLTIDSVEAVSSFSDRLGSPQPTTSSYPSLPNGDRVVSDRTTNLRIDLKGFISNIPSIAFCNTREDPDGRWLVSTDIAGHMVIWDVWLAKPFSFWKFGDRLLGAESEARVVENRGWGVLCLDPRSSRSAEEIRELFGCTPKYIQKPRREYWDNTETRGMVRDSSVLHGSQDIIDEYTDAELNYSGLWDEDDPLLRTFLPNMAIRDKSRRITSRGYFTRSEEKLEDKPKYLGIPFRILHTTAKSIRLIDDLRTEPSIICHSPLAQITTDSVLIDFERLNMLAQVPELGLVFVATQAGRVAVLSLTQGRNHPVRMSFRIEVILPFRSQEKQLLRPPIPLLGIAVGPLQNKAMESLRGDSGGEGRREPIKRIRLMMTYMDRTVMSYEISRTDNASYYVDNELLGL